MVSILYYVSFCEFYRQVSDSGSRIIARLVLWASVLRDNREIILSIYSNVNKLKRD